MSEQATDVEGLATRLLAALQKATTRSTPTDDDGDEEYFDAGHRRGSVSVDRLRREIDKRKALESQLGELRAQVEQLSAGYKTQLDGFKTQTADQLQGIARAHAEDLALVDAGLTDPLGRQALRLAWEGMPKDGRGKSPVEWWGQQLEAVKAHQADPEKVAAPSIPRPLVPYLPAPEQQTQQRQQPVNGQQTRSPLPSAPGKPAAFGTLDPSQGIDALMQQLSRMG